ncbi:cholinesterase 1 [Galendromus occidentalis]|uniref:Cholinesterase 1 n=1 Tax=Galendromus occidentalis TaxID=34638 RepID=A0AAJ6QPT1_9ACAR|nr:cholinesterase 1 [Galendromus occidentalis]
MQRIFAVFALFFYAAAHSVSGAAFVNLTSGGWNGLELELPGVSNKVEVFYGVRYAEPPVGDLRFRHPVPRAYSGASLDATKPGHACIQGNTFYIRSNVSFGFAETSEDCLHVNIYRPKGAQNAPMAVYLHGGTFVAGFNKLFLYDAEELAARENIIIAVVNYRLSVLGFLYLNHTNAPGNQGLFDTLLAAKFVQQNARALGGDPDRITLWGQSAGGMAAGFLLASPLAKGIFKRAILQSGVTAAATPALRLNNVNNAVSAASVLDCVDSNRTVDEQLGDMAQCMKKIDAQRLFDAVNVDLGERYTITFQPMYGIDDMLPVFPFPANYSEVPLNDDVKEVLTSTVSDEGAMFIWGVLERFQYADSSSVEDFISLSQVVLKVVLEMPAEYVKNGIPRYISPSVTDQAEMRKQVSDLFRDVLFECPVDMYSDFLATRGVKVYRYLWNHKPSTSYWPEWAGATHCDDIPFVMGSQFDIGNKAEKSNQASAGLVHFLKTPITEAEKQLIRDSLKMIGDFVKTGVPSRPDGSPWPLYTAEKKELVRIEVTAFSNMTGPHSGKCSTWKDFVTNKKTTRLPIYTLEDTTTAKTPAVESNEIVTKRPRKKKGRYNNGSPGTASSHPWILSLILMATIRFL